MTTSRDDLKQLVDELDDDDVGQAGIFLLWLIAGRTDPVLLALADAPIDNDELTADERMALDGAATAQSYSHGDAQAAAHEAAKRRLGIT